MTASVIGALRVNLGLDSANFQRGAKRVKSPLAEMKRQFSAVAGAAVAFGAAISASALMGARDIDKAAKAARRLDASVGGFRALELAAEEAGVSASSLANDVQSIDREIASIGKTGNAKRALDALGLSVDDLAGKDADQKLAIIADSVQDLGLTSGEATSILRDLGVRNREMVLLVSGGGDAIRRARSDIEDYGLSVSDVDAKSIEAANDSISRLALIGRYAGQQLALELVPAMGRLATSMTDSLRVGGVLRTVIDGLAENIQRISTYVAVAVTGFGVRYVGALVAARLATVTFAGSLIALRTALVRAGIGALIVGAGEIVFQISRLVTATGGWGQALSALGDLASGVWEGIKTSAQSIKPALGAIWKDVQANFFVLMENITVKWREILLTFASAAASTPGGSELGASLFEAAGRADAAVTGFMRSANDAETAAIDLRAEAASLATQGFDKASAAAARLRDLVSDAADETDTATNSANVYNNALSQSEQAAGGVARVADTASALSESMNSVKTSTKSAFTGIVTGAKSVSDALKDVLTNLASILANSAFESLFGSLFQGGGSGLFSGLLSFDGGGYTGAGARSGGVDGRGGFPAILHPNETIVDHTRGQSGGSSSVLIQLSPELVGTILSKSADQSIEIAGASMAVQDRKTGMNVRAYSARKG